MTFETPDSATLIALANTWGLPLVLLYLIGRPLLSGLLARLTATPATPTDVPAVPAVARPFPLLSALLEAFFQPRKQQVPSNLKEIHPDLRRKLVGECKELFGLVEPDGPVTPAGPVK